MPTYARANSFRWLYLLAALPTLTDMLENGGLPSSPRSWFTEVLVGLVIALLVSYIRRAHLALLALAGTDPLTGLHNRRTFLESAEEDCARARRTGQPLSLVYMDLDNFKLINDAGGHAAGDEVLQQISSAIRRAVRSRVDRGFRLGGDEFAILLPGSSAVQAARVLLRLRDLCEQADPVWAAGVLDISSGVVEYRAHESAEAFIRRGDEAMYGAKRLRKEDQTMFTIAVG